MKQILFILILFAACPCTAHTQADTSLQGTIRYLVTHDWTKKMAAVDYISKQRRERIAYMWGNRSEWKLYTTLYFSPTASRYEDSEERAEPDDDGFSWRKEAYSIGRDFEKNTTQDLMVVLGKNYLLEDTLIPQKWKIQNDLKEVAGHICMKAYWEDTLKMQKVVAWFAQDIPLNAGPERFCGLPGLILEVDVNNGGMIVSADRITMHRLNKELDLPKKGKAKKIKEADYTVLLKKHMEEKRKAEEPPFWGIRY